MLPERLLGYCPLPFTSLAHLAAGTNIGAYVKAAQKPEDRPGFFHEMNVALQQASRTEYWLQLLHKGGLLADKEFNSMHTDCEELIKLLKSITKPTRTNRQPTPSN